jgi:hypothetical protein
MSISHLWLSIQSKTLNGGRDRLFAVNWISVGCMAQRKERAMQRWRVLLYYAVATYGLMYVLGTLHVPGGSLLDPVAVEHFSHDAGLPEVDERSPTRLMRALAVPSLVLLALQLYRAGLGTRYWVVFQVRRRHLDNCSARGSIQRLRMDPWTATRCGGVRPTSLAFSDGTSEITVAAHDR